MNARSVTFGLELNKGEKAFLERLKAHNWLYPMSDTDGEYKRSKDLHERLKAIAEDKGGNYSILFNRMLNTYQNYDHYKTKGKARFSKRV